MYTVYVLKSVATSKRYVGVTSNTIKNKLDEHNSGATKWTSKHRPFEVICTESFENKTQALKREKFLKSGDGRRVLDRIGQS